VTSKQREDHGGLALLGSLAVGAGLMYYLDPLQGRRRRSMAREKATHLWHRQRDVLDKAGRDLSHRAHGMIERVKHLGEEDASDAVIEERVRSQLGRVVSHPGSIDVAVADGRVALYGPVLSHEQARLVRCIRKVRGVREVVDRLSPHARPGAVPGLQGEGRVPRRWPRREVWPPASRVLAIGAGGLLAGWALATRDGLFGKGLALIGGALLARGVVNQPLGRIIGVGEDRRGIEINKTMTVYAPVERIFSVLSRFDELPRFLQHVRSVTIDPLDDRRSRWEVDGPAGAPIRFEAELTTFVPDRLIAWRTLPDQPIAHEGAVHFEAIDGGARLHIRMRYEPPGGALGHALSRVLGWDPKSRMDDDLVRVKALLEQGHTRAHGARVSVADLH
jgi:uncharacterized membrane protein